MKRKPWTFAVCALAALGLIGCGTQPAANSSASSSTTAAKTSVAVATINDYPPFEYVQNGKLTGFDIELLQDIANSEHLNLNWKVMKFDGIISGLQANQVDAAISAITIRPDRAQVVNFASPYFDAGLSLVVKKGSSIHSAADLKGKTITAKQGTTGLAEAQKLAHQYGAKVSIVQDDASLYLAVESGQADAMIEDYPGVAYKIKTDAGHSKIQIVGPRLTSEQYGIAVTKSNKTLLNEINDGLKKLKADGEYAKLHTQFFGS